MKRAERRGCGRRSANRAYAIGDAAGECRNYDLIDGAVVGGTSRRRRGSTLQWRNAGVARYGAI